MYKRDQMTKKPPWSSHGDLNGLICSSEGKVVAMKWRMVGFNFLTDS